MCVTFCNALTIQEGVYTLSRLQQVSSTGNCFRFCVNRWFLWEINVFVEFEMSEELAASRIIALAAYIPCPFSANWQATQHRPITCMLANVATRIIPWQVWHIVAFITLRPFFCMRQQSCNIDKSLCSINNSAGGKNIAPSNQAILTNCHTNNIFVCADNHVISTNIYASSTTAPPART